MKRYAIILAAGKGTRMKSDMPKVCHPICGQPMVQYIVDNLTKVGVDEIFLVVGHRAEQVKQTVNGNVTFITQEQQLGTGHAVQQVVPHLQEKEGITLVLTGDTPLIQTETLQGFVEYHQDEGAKGTVLTTLLDDPTGYGRIVRSLSQQVSRIVEEKDTKGNQKEIREVNSGIFCFDTESLVEHIGELGCENAQNEYYLTDMVSLFAQRKKAVFGYRVLNHAELEGINDRVQLARAEANMRRRINERWMREGVTLIDPQTTYIEAGATIGRDTCIYPQVFIDKKTIIGEGCLIESGSDIRGSMIGDGSVIRQSYVTDSVVGCDVTVGPFAHIRPDSVVGDKAKVGNFVELKKTILGEGSKANHLSYLGDTNVGRGVNIGCGAITVNYDGRNKHRTTIGDGAFVGCNVNLIAPVSVGENAVVAAGTSVTEDVPKKALAIGRSRQTNKEWYAKKKEESNALQPIIPKEGFGPRLTEPSADLAEALLNRTDSSRE